MKFEQALAAMREGKKVRRKSWSCGYILIEYGEIVDEKCIRFGPCQEDILAEDWEIYEERWQPKEGKWFITPGGDIEMYPDVNLGEATEFGVSRACRKQAEKARDKMRTFNRLLAYADEHAPDYEPEWGDNSQWCVLYHHDREQWIVQANINCQVAGCIYMPEEVAKKLVDYLNSGRVEL